jgi:hypothetical protein
MVTFSFMTKPWEGGGTTATAVAAGLEGKGGLSNSSGLRRRK